MEIYRKNMMLTALSLLLLFTITLGESHVPERCLLDDDGTSPELDMCLREGEDFVETLLDHIRANSRKRQQYNVCKSFGQFKKCIEPLMRDCSTIRHKLNNNWKLIFDVVNCACNGTTSCKNSLDCFVEQFKSRLGKQCDALYRFNVKQGTNGRCHFLYENIRCKEALVESACSPEAGVFAFHVAKVANRLHIAKHRCAISRDRHYNGFRYSTQCPANLTAVLEQCDIDHIGRGVGFRQDFDLIIKGGKKKVRNACKDFEAYEACLRPIKDTCMHGISKVYDYDGELRRYLLKMEYICSEDKEGYMEHLKCYRELLDNDTLAQCNYIWEKLHPMLKKLNAHGFYCLPHSEPSKAIQATLVNITKCYEDVFDKSCGTGGDIIGKLMTKVFKDPAYLRYRFHPDCALHSREPFATSGPILPTKPPRRYSQTQTPRPPDRRKSEPENARHEKVHSSASIQRQWSPLLLTFTISCVSIGYSTVLQRR